MKLNFKQGISLGISLVFLAATAFLLYNYFGSNAVSTPPVVVQSEPVKGLLPHGATLQFDVLKQYNGGNIQPFPYPEVSPGEVGISVLDLVKPATE
jgi:hypothetical protein